MANERAILCGEVPVGNLPLGQSDPLQLHLWGKPENVRLQMSDIRSHLLQDIPSPFHDLVEIATYVYVADQATTRGGDGVDVFGAVVRKSASLASCSARLRARCERSPASWACSRQAMRLTR